MRVHEPIRRLVLRRRDAVHVDGDEHAAQIAHTPGPLGLTNGRDASTLRGAMRPCPQIRYSLCLLAIAACGGCEPGLGACDEVAARRVVFDVNGYPAYEGQALVQVSCGNGAFCHAVDLAAARRLGAPAGLSFDMVGSRTPSDRLLDVAAIDRLAIGRDAIAANAEACLGQVRSGAMPPGAAGADARASGVYPGLPSIDDANAEILRNWLACGSPVVERTSEPRAGLTHRDECPPGDVGVCIVRDEVEPVAPTFASIYARILYPACGNSCHGPAAGPSLAASHDLDLSSARTAYEALLSPGDGTVCGGATRVVPGSPETSLLIDKLEERLERCGQRMPDRGPYLDDASIEAIRTWIAEGAVE